VEAVEADAHQPLVYQSGDVFDLLAREYAGGVQSAQQEGKGYRGMIIIRFDYERRYRRRGVLIDTRWFLLRFYPPIWPAWSFWRIRRKKAKVRATPDHKE